MVDMLACAGENKTLFIFMKFLPLATAFASLVCGIVTAAEGFWLPAQLTDHANQAEHAVAQRQFSNVDTVNSISKTLVRLGECSGVFVSADGLVLTSARCLTPYMSAHMTQGSAAIAADDAPLLPGLSVYLFQEQQDVSVGINRRLNESANANDRLTKLAELKQEFASRCQQQQRYCELTSLHYSLQFFVEYYQQFDDVRLVYLPAQQSSDPQVDWPRYDADFALVRVYQADGRRAKTPFAQLSATGPAEQQAIAVPDFVPASRRYSSVEEIRFMFEQLYPARRQQLEQTLLQLRQMTTPQTAGITDLRTSLQQQYLQLQSQLSEYRAGNLLASRSRQQQRLIDWITISPVRQQLYGAALERFSVVLHQQQQLLLRDQVLENLRYARLPALAIQLYQWADSSDSAEKAGLRKEIADLLDELEQGFDARTDAQLALHFLEQYSQLPATQRLPALDQYFALSDGFNRDIVRHKLSAIYRMTSLTDSKKRRQWLAADAVEFRNSEDPLINFAVAMRETARQLTAQRQQLQAELLHARAAVVEVIMAFNDAHGASTYADANGSLRFSVGIVEGYQPKDAVWYMPFSRLSDTADTAATEPVVANFLSSADSCGDVLGAPAFNANAEVVGVMYASSGLRLLSDWHYESKLSRAVHVDSRYIVWHLQQSAGGKQLLHEMALAGATSH